MLPNQSRKRQNMFKNPYVLLFRVLSLTPKPITQGACPETKSLSSSAKLRFCYLCFLASSARRDRGRQLKARALFTAAWGRKQADVNEGWRFHEAQLVDGRFNVTGLNWAMIRTVCKIHFLAGLCPPAPSSKRSSPSPSSYAFECNKNWTRHCCAQFFLTTITFKGRRKREKSWIFFFVTSSKWFFPSYWLQSKQLCVLHSKIRREWWFKGACRDASHENRMHSGPIVLCCCICMW